jgi:hypothetical protein
LSFMPDCCCCSYVLELRFSGFRFCKYHGCWRWICLWLQMGASWLLKVDFRMIVNWVHRQLLKMDLLMVLVELWWQEECALAIQVLATNLCTCFFVH